MEEEKPSNGFYKSTKTSLKSVSKDSGINVIKITKVVINCNQVVTQTLIFMKRYLSDQYEKHNQLPTIIQDLIRNCMIVLCKKSERGA